MYFSTYTLLYVGASDNNENIDQECWETHVPLLQNQVSDEDCNRTDLGSLQRVLSHVFSLVCALRFFEA